LQSSEFAVDYFKQMQSGDHKRPDVMKGLPALHKAMYQDLDAIEGKENCLTKQKDKERPVFVQNCVSTPSVKRDKWPLNGTIDSVKKPL
jgi:hypothetical protein